MAVAFSAADADADGRITMDEFETLFGAASSYDREMLRSVFEKVDRNQARASVSFRACHRGSGEVLGLRHKPKRGRKPCSKRLPKDGAVSMLELAEVYGKASHRWCHDSSPQKPV